MLKRIRITGTKIMWYKLNSGGSFLIKIKAPAAVYNNLKPKCFVNTF
ncbi:MAG: hypothetical protein K1X86_03530 [Ignavibacteria bacterium]|nr:hypothetical protein [Ignavibacteria bacterium]